MRSTFMRASALGGLVMAGSLMLPVSAAASSSLTFYVPNIGGKCLYVTAPPDETLSLVWKDSVGTVKDTASFATDIGDHLYFYCSSAAVIAVGDRLKITDGSATHSLVIPNLTARINRVTDVIRGIAPPNSRVRVECGGSGFATPEPCIWSRNLTADSAGNWKLHIPWDLFGGWTMYARWRNAPGDVVYRTAIAPWFEVFLNQARFAGVAQPGTTSTVRLQDSSLTDKGAGTGVGDPEGSFSGHIGSGGQLVTVVPGDEARSDIASDAHFVVPNIDATATAADDRVVGQCEVNATSDGDVVVELFRAGHRRGYNEDYGTFDFDFKDAMTPADVRVGDMLFIKCSQREGDYAVKVIFAQ